MPLQMRPKNGGDPYAPERDIVNVFPGFARSAVWGVSGTDRFGPLGDYLNKNEVTEQELGEAAVAIAQYIGLTTHEDTAGYEDALEKSGLMKTRPEARIAIFSSLGQVVLGYYFNASRDAFRLNETPSTYQDLLAETEKFQAAVAAS